MLALRALLNCRICAQSVLHDHPMLPGILFVTVVLGIAMHKKKDQAKPLKEFFHALAETMFAVVDFIMW